MMNYTNKSKAINRRSLKPLIVDTKEFMRYDVWRMPLFASNP